MGERVRDGAGRATQNQGEKRCQGELTCDVGGGQVPREPEGLGGGRLALPGRNLPEVPAPAVVSDTASQEDGAGQCGAGHAW